MNKAFVREPEPDGRAFCPRCGTLGTPVENDTLNEHVQPDARNKLGDSAWYCPYARCDAAYFNLFEAIVLVSELNAAAYPYDLDAPMCGCFGFAYDDVEADVRDGTPTRIRELLARSQTAEAQCSRLAIDGQCCLGAVQELYMRLRSPGR
jgi:hypothetical protein